MNYPTTKDGWASKERKLELKETIQPLCTIVEEVVNKQSLNHRNKNKLWKYGYDEKYDIVIISKNGTLGDIYHINGINIGLPKQPAHINKKNDRWKPEPYPKELSKIKKMAEWNKKDYAFKANGLTTSKRNLTAEKKVIGL